MDLTFTLYKTAKTNRGEKITRTWEEWCEFFAVRQVREEKDGQAIVFGKIEGLRNTNNVAYSSAIGIDIEKLPDEQIEQGLKALNAYEYFAWTTHSHSPDNLRLRIVLPFANPISPLKYKTVWTALNQKIHNINDEQTKDISRLHYLPSVPEKYSSFAREWRHKGRFITADDLDLELSTDEPRTKKQSEQLQPEVILDLTNKIKNKLKRIDNNDELKPLVKILLAGDSYPPGERHNSLLKIAWWLATKDQHIHPQIIETLFGPTLNKIRFEDPTSEHTVEKVIKSYESATEKILAARGDRKLFDVKKQQEILCPEGPYSDEELAHIETKAGLSSLEHRWIIQRGGSHWILDNNGSYRGPYTKDDAFIAMSQHLSRAPINLINVTERGYSNRSLPEVVRDHGSVADKITSDLICQKTYYNERTNTLHEAVCPLRPIEPKYNEDIDAWFKVLAGKYYSKFVDWVSVVPDLNKLLCAIYFHGTAGAGKSLLAHGLAKLWNEGNPASIELILGGFNDEITRCPLIFADEELPRPYRTAKITTKLREMLSTFHRTLNRKYLSPTTLRGAIRLILAANNQFLLETSSVSTANDLKAISQRFLYINVTDEATEYINNVPRDIKRYWGDEGIAAHALWLAEHHTVKTPGSRFYVEGDMSESHRILLTGSGWNSRVCEWIVRYLDCPNLFDVKASGFIRRGNGELLINVQALIDGWDLYLKTKTDPDTSKLGVALRAISVDKKQKRWKGKRIWYHVIDLAHIFAWMDLERIGSKDIILAAVNGIDMKYNEDDDIIENLETTPSVNFRAF